MEAEHTPGLVVPGSSQWDGTDFWTVETQDGTVICQEPTDFSAYASGAFITPDGQEANRDHIVACWNACEGINPEAVPELLEAYKAAMASQLEERENKSMMCLTCGHAWVGGDEHHADGCWVGTARAAIAKATKGE